MKRSKLFFLVLTLFGFGTTINAQNVTFGFLQNPSDPLEITAVAYPSFTSNNVTISAGVFSFLLPAGTVTNPSISGTAPNTGSFNDITGVWEAQYLTPATSPANLQGNDVYQVVLQNSPVLNNVQTGVPIELFSFSLASDCMGGNVEVLTNNSQIQASIFNELIANFNNSFDASVNDAMALDIYSANNPSTFSIPCPIDDTPTATDDITSTPPLTPVNIPVLINDGFGNNGPGTGPIVITNFPGGGVAVVNTNNTPNDPTDDTIDYVPNSGFSGIDRLSYRICDSDGDCDFAEVSISVQASLPPPVDLPAIPMSLKILPGVILLGVGTYAASRVMS